MVNRIVIGIDPSFTGTAVYTNCDDSRVFCTDSQSSVPIRIIDIWSQIESFISTLYIRHANKEHNESGALDFRNVEIVIGIEGFSHMSRGKYVGNMYGLGWFLRCKLVDAGFTYFDVPPNSWKKYLFGRNFRTGIGKDHILLETYRRYQMYFNDNNVCDAYNIMRFTEKLYSLYIQELSVDDIPSIERDLFRKILPKNNFSS